MMYCQKKNETIMVTGLLRRFKIKYFDANQIPFKIVTLYELSSLI